MRPEDVLDLFRRTGGLLQGHFRLSSGLHSGQYLQCALVLQFPRAASRLGAALAERCREMDANVVLSPALGGIVIGHEVARALGTRALFAERQDGAMTLRRGFTLTDADRVLVVEDVVTTGGSTRETIDVARAASARVVGAAAIIDRSSGDAIALGAPFVALARMDVPVWDAESCPQCASRVPVVKPGSRTA